MQSGAPAPDRSRASRPGPRRLPDSAPMIARDQALAALAADPFDVVVVGGGITGAGVALDAATRGYCVALVERADYASGTSSRSSKLVHGGLRYLQNFDLGLVREALLERQLMVKLAPHLVQPLPLVVAAFDGQRPDRLSASGLNLYDVMAVEQAAPPRAQRGRGADERRSRLEPGAPPHHPRRRGRRARCPALADAQADLRLPLLRLPDRRRAARADRARRGRALRRGLRQRRSRCSSSCEEVGQARGVCVRDRESATRSSTCARRTSSTRPASGPTACAPTSSTTRPRCRVIRPSRGTHITLTLRDAAAERRRDRPGRRRAARSSPCRGSGRR